MLPLIFLAAQEEGGEQASGSSWTFLIYIVIFVAIFYFLLIRPGQKQKKEHKRLVDSINKGDEIVTAGGIYGTIKRVGDDFVMVEVAKKTTVKLSRASIARTISVAEAEEEIEEEIGEEAGEEEVVEAGEPGGEPSQEPGGEETAEKGEGQEEEPGRER